MTLRARLATGQANVAWRGRAHRPTGPHRPPHRLPEPASLRDPVAATLPGALSCPPPRPFRQRASPEQREAPLRNHSTHIRTVSGGSPAIFRPLTPLTVPLLLKPRQRGCRYLAPVS